MSATFEQLEIDLEEESYPLTSRELRDAYGDEELDLPGGSENLGDVLARVEVDEFETATDALETIATGIDVDGVGRVAYSDRGSSLGESRQQSF